MNRRDAVSMSLGSAVLVILCALFGGCAAIPVPEPEKWSKPQDAPNCYYVTSDNYAQISKELQEKYPVFAAITSVYFEQASAVTQEHQRQMVQLRGRPLSAASYDLLNMVGCWLKMAQSSVASGPGGTALTMMKRESLMGVILDTQVSNADGLMFIPGSLYCRDEEYGSSDPAVIAYKQSVLDLVQDNFRQHATGRATEYLRKLADKETTPELLARLTALCRWLPNG